MNRPLLFSFFTLSLLISPMINAQPGDKYFSLSFDTTDSNFKILNFSTTKFYHFKNAPVYVFNYRHEVHEFIDSTASISPIGLDKIDFDKNSLALISYHGGDCHATFSFESQLIDEAKLFTITVIDHYGGCRAGGYFLSNWVLIPKLPYDYKVELQAVFAEDFGK